MKAMRTLLLLIALSVAALAAEPANRYPIPDPALLIDTDSFAISVVNIQGDREPIQTLLKAALNSIATGEAKLPPSMADAADYLARNNRADMLIAGLPYQAVRVDKMAGSQTSPVYSSTLAGWRGLQVQIYNGLSAGDDGKAYPSAIYKRVDLITRPNNVLTRVNGTMLFAPDAEMAKKLVDRLSADKPAPVSGPLQSAYQALPKSADAYGVLINNKGAFSALLKSMNNEHIEKIREKVGSDRLERGVAATKSAVWKVSIVTDDRAELEANLTVDPAQAAEIAQMFQDGSAGLDPTKATDFNVTQTGDQVTVKLAVIGLKQVLLDTLTQGSLVNVK